MKFLEIDVHMSFTDENEKTENVLETLKNFEFSDKITAVERPWPGWRLWALRCHDRIILFHGTSSGSKRWYRFTSSVWGTQLWNSEREPRANAWNRKGCCISFSIYWVWKSNTIWQSVISFEGIEKATTGIYLKEIAWFGFHVSSMKYLCTFI